MPRDRFVTPETTRLPLSDGDWIDVKKRLTYSEELRLQTAGITGVDARMLVGQNGSLEAPPENQARINWEAHAIERIALYVVGWSFQRRVLKETSKDGKKVLEEFFEPVKLTRDANKSLDLETATEIAAALDTHIAAMEAEKASDPTRSAPATSASS